MKKIYYIKIDGEVKQITEEERKKFLDSIKKENKKYICPDCKVCDCEKIVYSDIRRCSEVNTALLDRTIMQTIGPNGYKTLVKDDILKVYDCEKFEPFEQVIINKERIIAKEILDITAEMLQIKDKLKDNNTKEDYDRFVKLSFLKKSKINSITNKKVLERLNKELIKLKGDHIQKFEKTKVLVNE